MRWEPGHVGMQYEQFKYELHSQFYGIDVSLIGDSQKKCVTCSNKASISLSNWCLGEWLEELGYSAQRWIELLSLQFLTVFGNFLTSQMPFSFSRRTVE
jgi:hypothetical protein